LSLNSNVLGPLHETSEVSLWLDVTSQSEVAWVLLEETGLASRTRCSGRADNNLLSFNSFLHLLQHNESY
jgi:hypothetical protein